MGVSGLGSCNRLRYDHHLTSELEGDKMVLKITKPPRNKDSFSSLTGQTLSWLMKVCFSNWTVLFFLMSVAVRLATYYEKISKKGTATILLSKHISYIAINKLLIGMESYF
jgi:hypothetical protein